MRARHRARNRRRAGAWEAKCHNAAPGNLDPTARTPTLEYRECVWSSVFLRSRHEPEAEGEFFESGVREEEI
jgi:hypothetical protein